jgi:hypothetical protein
MNISLQNQYNQLMRRDTVVPGMVREETRYTVRYTNPHGSLRYVLWHRFPVAIPAAQFEALIDEEIADASKHADALCWRIHDDDAPCEPLIALLLKKGFHPDADSVQHFIAPQSLIDNTLHANARSGFELRELVSPVELEAYKSVWDEIWPGMPNARYVADYQALMESGQGGMRFWAAFEGVLPVATGYLVHSPGSPMALLCGGTTRAAYQRRGLYHALVAVRARAALAAGVETLCVDASSESAPVLAKLGFAPQVRVRFYEKAFTAS